MRFRPRVRLTCNGAMMILRGVGRRSSTCSRRKTSISRWKCIPTEIAFDIATANRALAAVGHHRRFGFNYDPSHLGYQGVDYVRFIREFADRIYHVHMKDVWWGHGDGTVGVFGGHADFADCAPLLGFPLAGPRRHQVRGHHRRVERCRLPRAALRRMGGQAHGPRPRRDRIGRVRAQAQFHPDTPPPSTRPSRKSKPEPDRAVNVHRKLRYGMVGGGRDAFIGAVHRMAAQPRRPDGTRRGLLFLRPGKVAA